MLHGTTNFELTSSGSPVIFYHLNDLKIKTYSGFTAVQSEITITASDITYLQQKWSVRGGVSCLLFTRLGDNLS